MTESTVLTAGERTARRQVCFDIVEAVAEREGVPEDQLAVPLYEVVDPDALQGLLGRESTARHPTEVRFDYAGYRVTARSDGTIEVE